jgi:hypothetical protein
VLIRAQCGGVTKPQSGFSLKAPDVSFWLPENLTAGVDSLLVSMKQAGIAQIR